MKNIPVLGFAAFSGVGKTSLLKKLIPLLKAQGLKVGVIKKSHHDFEIDYPGKDSHELRLAGASPVMLTSSHRRAIITEREVIAEPTLMDELAFFDQTNLSLILVEGFKNEKFPKIELHRPELGKPLLCIEDDSIIAVATDSKLNINPNIPLLDINQPGQISEFILKRFFFHDKP